MTQDDDALGILLQARFGARVRQLRQEHGLTARQLADRMGTTESYLCRIERAEKGATPKTIAAIAKALDENIITLFITPGSSPVDDIVESLRFVPRSAAMKAKAALIAALAKEAKTLVDEAPRPEEPEVGIPVPPIEALLDEQPSPVLPQERPLRRRAR